MTDSNYSHILAIVDRSGSMSACSETMTEALNEYFKGQAALPGTCKVDYVQFDDSYEQVFSDRPVSYAQAVIEPRGMTALLDAVGKASVALGEKLKRLPEHKRPGRVQVVIVTDGHENASNEWTYEKVKELVEQQESQWNWDYVFLGANIDAPAVGARFGVKGQSSITFATANAGQTMNSLNNYTTSYRGGQAAAFSDEDRKNAVDTSSST